MQTTLTQLSVWLLDGPMRLDTYLAQCWPQHSRTLIQAWISAEQVIINGAVVTKARHEVKTRDELTVKQSWRETLAWQAQSMDLAILHEDSDIIVIHKPAGLVVHPGAGIAQGTLANGLLAHHDDAAHLPRAGIVHRLDKDTSGCLVAAKSEHAYQRLIAMMKRHEVTRRYVACVHGNPWVNGCFDEPIGRDRRHRTRMAVHGHQAKEALTHYQVLKRCGQDFAWLRLQLETGRTHQIRVHCSHHGFPLVGDATYGRAGQPKFSHDGYRQALLALKRQALHAQELCFKHPCSGKEMSFETPLPDDLASLYQALFQ